MPGGLVLTLSVASLAWNNGLAAGAWTPVAHLPAVVSAGLLLVVLVLRRTRRRMS